MLRLSYSVDRRSDKAAQGLVMHILWDFWEENEEIRLRYMGDGIHTTIFLFKMMVFFGFLIWLRLHVCTCK